jgi:hypothetical protein
MHRTLISRISAICKFLAEAEARERFHHLSAVGRQTRMWWCGAGICPICLCAQLEWLMNYEPGKMDLVTDAAASGLGFVDFILLLFTTRHS